MTSYLGNPQNNSNNIICTTLNLIIEKVEDKTRLVACIIGFSNWVIMSNQKKTCLVKYVAWSFSAFQQKYSKSFSLDSFSAETVEIEIPKL